jgi:2-polyprenyl-3-methyl-5-hydroxy-6-metoxy-1,4-benzoquinol methylase
VTVVASIEVALDPEAAREAFAESVAPDANWAPDWASGAEIEIETRFEPVDAGTRITVELRGWDEAMESVTGPDERERAAWFAEHVAAPLAKAAASDALAGWMTDRIARQPTGARAREIYRDPEDHKPGFRAVLDALAPGPDDHLLEIACGGGVLLAWALETGCRATGLDHSEEMVRLAREVAPKAEVVLGKAESLPFEDGTFTCVASATAFFFFPDPVAVLREARRVLRPGGRLAIATTPPEMRGTPAAPEPMASIGRFYTDEELAALAVEAGFADVSVTRDGRGSQLLTARKA